MLSRVQNFSCPCCGGHLGEAAPLEFIRDHIAIGHQKRIFDRLSSRVGREFAKESLIDAMYGDRSDGGPMHAENIVSIEVGRLRKTLERFGWSLISKGRGTGNKAFYRLTPTEVGP